MALVSMLAVIGRGPYPGAEHEQGYGSGPDSPSGLGEVLRQTLRRGGSQILVFGSPKRSSRIWKGSAPDAQGLFLQQ